MRSQETNQANSRRSSHSLTREAEPQVLPETLKRSLPFVSVVMPVRNESEYIKRSLEAVFTQDYPAESFEVIVADGMSEDGTREIVRQWQTGLPNLQLIDNPGRIAPTALNTAIAHARGEIIIRVDGHCEIAPDYISKCVAHLQNGGVDGVGG